MGNKNVVVVEECPKCPKKILSTVPGNDYINRMITLTMITLSTLKQF